MAGTISISTNTSTFNRSATAVIASTENAYYITSYNGLSGNTNPGPDGTLAPTSVPTTVIGKKYTKDATDYYVPGAALVTGLETTTYSYTGNDIIITPDVTYYGRTLTKDTDYVINYEKKNGDVWESASYINAVGDYHIIISGNGNYAGSYISPTIHVVNYNTWALVKSILADASEGDRNITLTADIYPENPSGEDVALVVNGTVVLNLNEHTIDRKLYSVNPIADPVVKGQVIRVNSGANLTINGSGTIKGGYNKAENGTENGANNDGGGVFNMGTLVMNNVVVTENKCVKYDINSIERTSRGGGVYNGTGSSFTMTGGEITNNDCLGGGGGVYCNGASVFSMNGVEVSNNKSESKGGGVRVKTSNNVMATLSNCIIQFNFATGNSNIDGGAAEGGGIYMESGNLDLNQCGILGNQSTFAGAGLYSHGGNINAKNCNIDFNGTYYESNKMKGGGVCLENSSVFTMDGGSIYWNNSYQDGGGIYVNNDATFNVKGDVKIYNSYKAGVYSGGTDNNAYLDGTSVINVVGPLGEDAIINITPHDGGGVAVEFADGASSGDSEKDLSHFVIDNNDEDDYGSMIVDDEVVVYEVTSWDDPTMWDGTIASDVSGDVPTSSEDVTIKRTVKIPNSCVAEARDITFGTYGSIIIEDGGQLINNNSVAVVAKKNVVAANAEAQAGWYLISSPVNNPAIAGETPATNLITTGSQKYDLYRFNESAELQWENYRASHADFTTLENGRGYLYRNSKDHTIDIGGTLNVSDITYTLSCSGSELTGFNIIGNPYSHNVYKGAAGSAIPNGDLLEDNYYMLNPTTGEWDLTNDGTAIAPMTGVLVQVREPGTLTMKNSTEGLVTPSRKSDGKNIWFTVAGGNYEDRACVEFKEGHGLNKIEHLNEEAPMLYIRHNGEDFASVDMNPEAKAFGLYFKAKTTGYYTLSVQPQGEFGYLHLIDKLTGSDVDMLKEEEYTFIGSAADKAERFVVRLSPSTSTGSETFAYQSGDDIIVEGEGELQVFDVMGRLMMKKNVNGLETIEKPSQTGVYIFRLDGQTQKIVVR